MTTDKLARILIIGKNEATTRSFADALASDYHISASPTVADAHQRIQKETFSIIIFDFSDEDSHLAESLRELQSNAPFTPVIVTSAQQESDLIVSAIKAGAFDFLTKAISKRSLSRVTFKFLAFLLSP